MRENGDGAPTWSAGGTAVLVRWVGAMAPGDAEETGLLATGPGRGGIRPRPRRARGAGQSPRPLFAPGCHGTSHSRSTPGAGETGAGNGWQRFPDGDFKLTEPKRVQFW